MAIDSDHNMMESEQMDSVSNNTTDEKEGNGLIPVYDIDADNFGNVELVAIDTTPLDHERMLGTILQNLRTWGDNNGDIETRGELEEPEKTGRTKSDEHKTGDEIKNQRELEKRI